MKKLMKGLHKFQTEVFPIHKDFFQDLAKGQAPEILFISCSDSRVNPNLVTSADPGDLFIMRNTGGIVPIYGSGESEAATIEFAVSELGVKDIIICGHSHCGAIEAALNEDRCISMPNLHAWVAQHIKPTLHFIQENYPNLDKDALRDILTQENVLQQVEHLKTHPVVAAKIAQNDLNLHAWVYRLDTGEICAFDLDEEQFKVIKKK